MSPWEKQRSFIQAPRGHGLASLWIAALAGAVVMSLLLHLRGRPDIDLWLHLRLGDELLAGTSFQQGADPLVALADQPYVPTQWLAEVLGSVAYQFGGLTCILVLRWLALMCLAVLLYLVARLQLRPGPAAVIAVLALVATSAAWGERPQLAGLVLMAAVTWLWSRCRRRGKIPWVTVPVFWLWGCVHGTWILGLLTGALFTVVIFVDAGGRLGRERFLRLLLVQVLSVVALCATPLGPQLLFAPFRVNGIARATVNEWQTPAPTNPLMLLVLLMGLAVLLSVALRRRGPRESVTDVLLVLVSAVLALYSVRTIAFAGVLAVPALASALASPSRAYPTVRRVELRPWVGAAVLLAVLPGALIGVDRSPPIAPPITSALNALPAGSRIVVEVRVSGWVLHAHPKLRPLRDLRAEAYSITTARAYESFMRAESGWQKYADAHGVEAMLLTVDSPLSRSLAQSGWGTVTAAGTTYELWVRAWPAKDEATARMTDSARTW